MSPRRMRTPIIIRPPSRPQDLVSANVRRAGDPLLRIRRWWRRSSRTTCGQIIRRQTALRLWCFVYVLCGVAIQLSTVSAEAPVYVLTEENRCVQVAARSAVERSLEVIGHGVKVARIDVGPTVPCAAAQYTPGSAEVRFSPEVFFDADEMLLTAAHESVHAIFDQAGLNPYSSNPVWDTRLLAEEVAAEVLGAHIAGEVRTRQGGDGDALTREAIRHFRDASDWSNPTSIRQRVWRWAIKVGPEKLNADVVRSIAVHYGPVEMIDAMDRICREHPDPWVAAHVIAERFIEPIPERVAPGQASAEAG